MASEIGRALAALRKPRQRVCAFCGKTFESVAPARYCTPQHRKLDWWRKHRAKKQPRPAPAPEGA